MSEHHLSSYFRQTEVGRARDSRAQEIWYSSVECVSGSNETHHDPTYCVTSELTPHTSIAILRKQRETKSPSQNSHVFWIRRRSIDTKLIQDPYHGLTSCALLPTRIHVSLDHEHKSKIHYNHKGVDVVDGTQIVPIDQNYVN